MRLENFKKIRPLSLNEILLVLLKKSVWRHFTANLKFCGFGKANFYLKNSPRSHTFHITLYWNRKVYLYPKAYWKILVWTSCMTSFSNFFIKWLLLTYNFLRSQTPKYILCVVWLRMMLSIFLFHTHRTI